jgi:hypothetical protein
VLRRGNESDLHYRVKVAVWRWLWDRGCRAIAFEASPDFAAGCRVDVLGWAPDQTTFLVEAKQSRGDFLRDLAREAGGRYRRAAAEMLALWERYEQAVEGARALADERGLRSHLELPEFTPFAEAHLRLALRVRRRLARAGGPEPGKFGLAALAQVARFCYLAAPPQVVAADEVPNGWGLLSYEGGEVRIAHPARPASAGNPKRVLAEIARVNTQDLMIAHGVRFTASSRPRFPEDPTRPRR